MEWIDRYCRACKLFGICLLLAVSSARAEALPKLPMEQTAVFDLRAWDFERDGVAHLAGPVRFYWQTYLSESRPRQYEIIPIPGSWHRVADFPRYGYASFEFDLLSAKEQILMLEFGSVGSAFRFYVNGELIGENGVPGLDLASTTNAKANIHAMTFRVEPGRTTIAMEIANFDFISSGFTKSILIGPPQDVMLRRYAGLPLAFLIFGAYLVMGLYHLGLFSLRKRDRSSLYFGLFCLATTPSTVINMQVNALELLGDFSLAFAVALSSSILLACGFLGLFIAYLYHSHRLRQGSIALIGLFTLYACAYPLSFQLFLGLLAMMAVFGILFGGLLTYVVVRAIKQRQDGAIKLLLACVILIGTALNDYANFNRWIHTLPVAHIGSLIFLMIQSYFLSSRFSRAFLQLEKSQRKIQSLSDDLRAENQRVINLNENLEHLAEEKIRDIRAMMNHLQLGIFAIRSANFEIDRDYSRYLSEILGVRDITKCNVGEWLLTKSHIDSDQISQAKMCLESSIGEDIIAFETNSHCLPAELQYRTPAGEVKLLELTWNPMVNENKIVEKILVTVRDVTEIRAMQTQVHDQEEELQVIVELMNISVKKFSRFMQDVDDFMDENRTLLDTNGAFLEDPEVLKVLFINMHTMKGAARSLYLKKMTRAFHEIEQYYANLQSHPQDKWDLEKMKFDLSEAQKIIDIYRNIAQDKLGRKINGHRDVEIAEGEIQRLYQAFVETSRNPELRNESEFFLSMQDFFLATIYNPVDSVLNELCEAIATLAKDLAKPPATVHIDVKDLYVNSQGEQLLRKICIHLLRNSMDHGIESPEDRLLAGKPESGNIFISIQQTGNGLVMQFQDDGRGLDLAKIRHTALARGIDQADLSPLQIADLIFYSGFSTASQLSDISGRGMGMEAVRRYLEDMGGAIRIRFGVEPKSVDDTCPFAFELRLPTHIFAQPILQASELKSAG